MRIYVFKSETKSGLNAYSDDIGGSKLPENHGPWTMTGVVGAANAPTQNVSRETIEEAIATHGFQMWRLAKAEAHAS